MKKIGFLSFGHAGSGPTSLVPDAGEAIRQSIDLAVAAEEVGFDGAWVRVHHFDSSLSAPFPLLAAMAARTSTIDLGTGVIDLRYENPLYMAEEAGVADQISRGRLQLGVSRGSPEPAVDGQEQFGYTLEDGQSWAQVTRERAARFREAISGKGIALSDPQRGPRQKLPITPQSPGLINRIWWGAASFDTGLWTAEAGMNLLSSTLLLEDDGRPFHVQQAHQQRAYREAYAAAGHTTGGLTAVTRSAFPITNDKDAMYFGRRESGDSVGQIEGSRARSGPTFAGASEEVARMLLADEGAVEADYVLFALPSQLGVDYNTHLMANIAAVAREIGWK